MREREKKKVSEDKDGWKGIGRRRSDAITTFKVTHNHNKQYKYYCMIQNFIEQRTTRSTLSPEIHILTAYIIQCLTCYTTTTDTQSYRKKINNLPCKLPELVPLSLSVLSDKHPINSRTKDR